MSCFHERGKIQVKIECYTDQKENTHKVIHTVMQWGEDTEEIKDQIKKGLFDILAPEKRQTERAEDAE